MAYAVGPMQSMTQFCSRQSRVHECNTRDLCLLLLVIFVVVALVLFLKFLLPEVMIPLF
jgi:hypothetical protein